MKKLLLLLLFTGFVNAQDYDLIKKMNHCSLSEAKEICNLIATGSKEKFQFSESIDKPKLEIFMFYYCPVGLNQTQKEEIKVNHYENGLKIMFSQLPDKSYKLAEFYAERSIMFQLVKKAFYPDLIFEDFTNNSKFWGFNNLEKKIKIIIAEPEKKMHFYNDSEQL